MQVNDLTLHLRPQSFFQTNTKVAEAMYAQGREWVREVAPRSLWDLYCGVGGFALHAASVMDGGSVTGIEISAEAQAEGVLVRVDDNGPGIPLVVRQRLFQPFVTSGKNGLGLGLALSRQTVLDHGGEIWVEEVEGGGAHFRLRLPGEMAAAVPAAVASV